MSRKQRLTTVRKLIRSKSLRAVVLVTGSRHNTEFLTERDKLRTWMTGFDGSAGTAIVTPSKAMLWTDGRYTIQAKQQLKNSAWKLMSGSWMDWLRRLPKGSRFGVDPVRMPIGRYRELQRWAKLARLKLVPLKRNLAASAWRNRPALKFNPIVPQVGVRRSAGEKVAALLPAMKAARVRWLLTSALDEIAWLLNLRGADVKYVPFFFSYLLVNDTGAVTLFASGELTREARDQLEREGVRYNVQPYEAVEKALRSLACSAENRIWMDARHANQYLYASVPRERRRRGVLLRDSPVRMMKAVKDESEMAGMRAAHLRDSAALVELYAWLEGEMSRGRAMTEMDVVHQLEVLRGAQAQYRGPSFPSIVSSGPHGAMVHYEPREGKNPRALSRDELLLIDSGGQYLDGTTDVTRMSKAGAPTAAERRFFTLVLKGHIAVALAKFSGKETGSRLDKLARAPLRKAGHSFPHSTGHGIGAYLSVHEGPIGIHEGATVPLRPGMVLSDEPGVYFKGRFGIRIESALAVRSSTSEAKQAGDKYEFEYLTFVPMQASLVDAALLSRAERDWLNTFHADCLRRVGPLVSVEAKAWLQRNTARL